jgi:hypothetical protein
MKIQEFYEKEEEDSHTKKKNLQTNEISEESIRMKKNLLYKE